MAIYLRKFETATQYEAAESELILPNVSLITETMGVAYKPYVEPTPPSRVITYEASAKLTETTSSASSGLHINAFEGSSGQLTITSHTFVNGVGTIEFNGDVTSIGSGAFYGCTSLTSIDIPNSVRYIYTSAFSSCAGLTSIEIPNSVEYIAVMAFANCVNLISVTIPNSIIITAWAFCNCPSLNTASRNAISAKNPIALECDD